MSGRIAAINNLLSKLREKSLPFFELLLNPKHFLWTSECEVAFQNIKKYLSSPLVLVPPRYGEILHLYVFISPSILSAVLCVDRQSVLYLVYIVSHVLQVAKTRYSPLEKYILAIIIVDRKLRYYFQAQAILMHTEASIRQSLHKYDITGQIMRWAIELSEYDITYTIRKLINVNLLSNFIVECTNLATTICSFTTDINIPSDCWTIHVDGSVAEANWGADLVITSPEVLNYFIP